MHFKNLDNLRVVAVGCLRGLKLLAEAGVVHCDMKARARAMRSRNLLGPRLLSRRSGIAVVKGRQLHVDEDG